MPGSLNALASHLEGLHEALHSLARMLDGEDGTEGARSQLEWSASHLYMAIHELRGDVPLPAAEPTPEPPKPRVTGGGLMEGLRGHTRAITIPEVLGFVASLRKSGVLRINSPDEAFLIQLEEGAVVYAQGDNPPVGERLGEILVRQGAISQAALDQNVEEDEEVVDMLGPTLLDRGLVSREALCIALSFQVQLLFHRVFAAEDAVFQFDEGRELRHARDIRLNVTSLLLESARSTDERAREDEDPDLRESA